MEIEPVTNSERLNTLPLRSRTKQGFASFLSLVFNTVLEVLPRAKSQEK